MAQAAMSGFGLITGAMSTIGVLKQSAADAQVQEFQATESDKQANRADQNANAVLAQSREQARRQREQDAETIGTIRASYGASGVTMDGTPQAYLEQNMARAAANELSIKLQGILEAKGYREDAKSYRRQSVQYRLGAENTRDAGTLKGIATGFGSVMGGAKDFIGTESRNASLKRVS